MPLKETPDLKQFYHYCSVQNGEPENGAPMIEVAVDSGFALKMLIDNSEENAGQKTYKVDGGGLRRYKLPLRAVLGTHFQSPHGQMDEVNPEEVSCLEDAVSPYATAVDYQKVIERLFGLIEENKEDIMRVIDLPPHIHEISSSSHFPSVAVDFENKVVRISRDDLEKFPNPLWPSRCLREIQSLDGFKVLIVNEDGGEEEFTGPVQIWGEEVGGTTKATLDRIEGYYRDAGY